MRATLFHILFAGFLLLSACSPPAGSHSEHQQMSMNELTIHFHAQPEQPSKKQNVQLTADIKQGKQPVRDGKVQFEVWTTPEKKQMLTSKQTQPGQYQANTSFEQAGTYQVIIHVVTPQTHQMRRAQFTVK